MLEYLLSLSLLIAAVLVIRAIFRKTVSPRAIYALWLVVLIRMLVPVTLFEIDVTVPEFIKSNNTKRVEHLEEPPKDSGGVTDVQEQLPSASPVQTTPAYPSQNTSPVTPVYPSVTAPATPDMTDTEINTPVITHDPIPQIPENPEPTPTADWKQIADLIWLCGAILAAAWVILVGASYSGRLYKDRRLLKTVHGTKVYVSDSAGVPCIAGFIPSIYITREAANSNAERLIIIHEYTHLRHGDHIWSIVRAIALTVFWWNPLVWIAATVSKQDAELACDDAVSAKMSVDDRLEYANILLDTIPQKHRYAVGLGSAPMKERILMLTTKQKNRLICLILAVVLTLSAVGCAFASVNEKEKDDPLTETTLPDNFEEFYYEAERVYELFTGYGANVYTDSTFSENGADYRSVDINGYTTLEELRAYCEQYFTPELTDELMSITASSEQHPLFKGHKGMLYKFDGFVSVFGGDADSGYDITLEDFDEGNYTVRIDAAMTENDIEIPATAYCTYTLTEDGEIRFTSFELMAKKLLEALEKMPVDSEQSGSDYGQGPFVGYVSDKDTPWIDLYTEVNGTWVARIPYEIFHDWVATDRTHEIWTPGWMSEYTCFYYAEFADFCWAAVHLGDTVLGVGRKNIATSADGGQTWSFGSTRDDYGGNHVVGIGFASENVAFMSFDPHNEFDGADGPVISRTVDGGRTWELLDISVPPALEGQKLIAGIPYYDGDILRYPVWLNTHHGKKEGEPMYLISRDNGLTWSWDSSSLPAGMTQYTVSFPEGRRFMEAASYGSMLPNISGNTIYPLNDGVGYIVYGPMGIDLKESDEFITYKVTVKDGYIVSVEEVATITKADVLENGKPYKGSLDANSSCITYSGGHMIYRSIHIADNEIWLSSCVNGTDNGGTFAGTYTYDTETGDFTAVLKQEYVDDTGKSQSIGNSQKVTGKLYDYNGFIHFICESSETGVLSPNDPLPLTFVYPSVTAEAYKSYELDSLTWNIAEIQDSINIAIMSKDVAREYNEITYNNMSFVIVDTKGSKTFAAMKTKDMYTAFREIPSQYSNSVEWNTFENVLGKEGICLSYSVGANASDICYFTFKNTTPTLMLVCNKSATAIDDMVLEAYGSMETTMNLYKSQNGKLLRCNINSEIERIFSKANQFWIYTVSNLQYNSHNLILKIDLPETSEVFYGWIEDGKLNIIKENDAIYSAAGSSDTNQNWIQYTEPLNAPNGSRYEVSFILPEEWAPVVGDINGRILYDSANKKRIGERVLQAMTFEDFINTTKENPGGNGVVNNLDSPYMGTTDSGIEYMGYHTSAFPSGEEYGYLLRHPSGVSVHLSIWMHDGDNYTDFYNSIVMPIIRSATITEIYDSAKSTITDIADWDSLPWISEVSEGWKNAQNAYNFIHNLVSGESEIPEYNGLGIKDYSITLIEDDSRDMETLRFAFTVTGNSLSETLPPGTYSLKLVDALDLAVYSENDKTAYKGCGNAHGLDEFGEYSAAQAVNTYLSWLPYIWETSDYGEWDMTNSHLPYNYICAYYGNNLEINFSELQSLMLEKFGIEVKRPEQSCLLSRCRYDKERDIVYYADTRPYEPVHSIIGVSEEDGISEVTVQLFADRLYLIPSHKVVYKIGEGEVFLGCEITETGKYEPREIS